MCNDLAIHSMCVWTDDDWKALKRQWRSAHATNRLMSAQVRCGIHTKTDSSEIACLKTLGPFMLLSVFVKGYRRKGSQTQMPVLCWTGSFWFPRGKKNQKWDLINISNISPRLKWDYFNINWRLLLETKTVLLTQLFVIWCYWDECGTTGVFSLKEKSEHSVWCWWNLF